jgi:putative ABC transport system substrate-binding protein
MKRREFITLIGGAAAAWPLSARAQPGERVRRVGVIIVNAENDPEGQARIAALRRGLQELRWTEGSNLLIDYRWRVSEPVRARALVGELVRFAPDAVVVNGTPGLAALQDTTRTIPVVFVMVVDPVGAGYVQSLARPGGNITGFLSFEPEIGGKWLELLKEIAPGLRRVAGILDPGFQGFAAVWRAIEILGPRVGLEVTSIAFRNPADDIESAIGAFAKSMEGGLIVLPTAVTIFIGTGSFRWLPLTDCQPSIRSRPIRAAADWCPTASILWTCSGAAHPMSTASCAGRSRPTFRCRRRPSTSW